MENIYAYTEPGSSFPAFVSLNMKGGKYIVSVRSRAGAQSSIELPDGELERIADSIDRYLRQLAEEKPQ